MRWSILFCWLGCLLWFMTGSVFGASPSVTAVQKEVACPGGGASSPKVPPGYVIGIGDLLQLSVWKDPALSRQMVVLPDGTVSLPLAGLVVAAGKTVAQLETEVKAKIKQYVAEPILDISVMQTNSMFVYIVGKVQNPGRFPVATDVNVLQALAMAGGPNRFADTDSIQVHRDERGKTVLLNFDYDEVLEGVRLEQNIRLRRGDVVVVP